MITPSQWHYRYLVDPIGDIRPRDELFTESSERWVFTTDVGERPDDAELIIRWGRQVVVASYGANQFGLGMRRDVESVVRFDNEKPQRADWSHNPDNESPQGGTMRLNGKFPGGTREFLWKMREHETLVVRFRLQQRYSNELTHTLTFDLRGLANALNEHPEIVLPKRPSAFGRLRTGFKVALVLGIGVVTVWACSAIVF